MKIRPSESFWDELLVNKNKPLLENDNQKILLVSIAIVLLVVILIGLLKISIWTGNTNSMKKHYKIELQSSVI